MQSKALATMVQSIQYEKLPAEATDAAKMCLQDLLGVTIAGSQRQEASIWEKYFDQYAGDAAVWTPGFPTLGYRQAAARNAAQGHLLDMDDVHNASITHLGVVTIPAALAVGQQLGKSGKDIIAAIVAGYEAGGRIGEAINPESYWHWHTTGIVAPFCAGTAAGLLMGLSGEEMLHCFGSAGTQSAGVWQFLKDGAMSKSLHTANGTLCGIRAAELAKLGFTGAEKILEGERALMPAVASHYKLNALTDGYGKPYRIMTNSFKPYACCRHVHSASYGIEKALAEHNFAAEDVVSISDRTYKTAVELTDNPQPVTPYACKFSLQYCVAAAIVLRDLSENAFSEEAVKNPAIRRLMEKITVAVDETLEAEFRRNPDQWTHILSISLASGEELTVRVDYPLGDYNNPFDWQKADAKFTSLTEGLIPAGQQRHLMETIKRLEDVGHISRLFDFSAV